VEALDALRARGLKLGVVSDYPALGKLRALGIDDHFQTVVSAQDPRVGAFKPNPRGLLVALEDLGVDRDHAVYVGDRSDVDGPAAAAAMMRCVLIGGTARGSDDVAIPRVTDFRTLLDTLERS
jgi:HAD superfamily hydrolase (TIGR01549 family)